MGRIIGYRNGGASSCHCRTQFVLLNHSPQTISFESQPSKSGHNGSENIRVSPDRLKEMLTDVRTELVLLDTSVVMPCSLS